MKTFGHLFLILLLNFNLSLSQTKSEIDALLNGISKTENSKHIIKTEQAEKIMVFGEKALPTLADFFSDLNLTTVESDCHERHLTKGEIAIIMADQISRMPYALLTGVQNCTLEFCKDNSNLIEYYFDWITRDGVSQFKEKYISWLSKDWIKGVKGKERRKRKKIIDEWKNASR
ncbi:hypothetical protein [Winogradskyella sp.]|uniref:hypothetical protein n=1 Tax=Winogradskyella sp. TaxID=1883156 RepID=UPI003BA8A1EB